MIHNGKLPSFARPRTKDLLLFNEKNRSTTNANNQSAVPVTGSENMTKPVIRQARSEVKSFPVKSPSKQSISSVRLNPSSFDSAVELVYKEMKPIRKQTPDTFQELMQTRFGCEVPSSIATRILNRVSNMDERNAITLKQFRDMIKQNKEVTFSKSAPIDSKVETTPTTTEQATTTQMKNSSSRMDQPTNGREMDSTEVQPKVTESEPAEELELSGKLLNSLESVYFTYATKTMTIRNEAVRMMDADDYKVLLLNVGVHTDSKAPRSGIKLISNAQIIQLVTLFKEEVYSLFNLSSDVQIIGLPFEVFCQSLVDISVNIGMDTMDFIRDLTTVREYYSSEEPPVEWKQEKRSGAVIDVPKLLDNAILSNSLDNGDVKFKNREQLLKEKQERKLERARIRQNRAARRLKRQNTETAAPQQQVAN